MKAIFVTIVISIGYFTVPALAHELWLERQAEGRLLVYGHKSPGHGGESRIDYPAGWIRRVLCLDGQGPVVEIGQPVKAPLLIERRCAATCVPISSGYGSNPAPAANETIHATTLNFELEEQ